MRFIVLLALVSVFAVACSDSDSDNDKSTQKNEFAFSYLNNNEELVHIQIKTQNKEVAADAATSSTPTEIPAVITSSTKRKSCKQNSYLSSVAGRYLFWNLPEACTSGFEKPQSLGVIDLKKMLVENNNNALVQNPKSNIFNVLNLFDVTGTRYVQIKIEKFPFSVIMDIEKLQVVGLSTQESKETVSIVTDLSGNQKAFVKFERFKSKLAELGLLNKSQYTKEELKQIQALQKSLAGNQS